MKKITFALIGLFYFNTVFAQTYSTGVIQLSNTPGLEYSAKIDVTTSIVTLTLVGPDNRWLGLGFGVQSMTTGGDVVIYDGTTLTDRYFGLDVQEPGGDGTGINPTEDDEGERDWTVVSNTVDSGVRTIVATRATDTGQTRDYTFSATATSIELVWARSRFEGYNLEWHGPANRGVTMQGLTLSTDDFQLENFSISPNPVKTNLSINLLNHPENTKVIVYDVLGKKVFEQNFNSLNALIDVSQWNSGIYLVKVSNDGFTHTKRFVKQ